MIFGLILEPAKMKATKVLKGKLKNRTEKVYKACMSILKSWFIILNKTSGLPGDMGITIN